jgi:hypothetical protein
MAAVTKNRNFFICHFAHLLFNLTSKVEIENGGVTHNFESGPLKDHFNSNF